MNYIRVHAGGITLETGGVQESQVSILWNCGLWAHHVGLTNLGIRIHKSSDIERIEERTFDEIISWVSNPYATRPIQERSAIQIEPTRFSLEDKKRIEETASQGINDIELIDLVDLYDINLDNTSVSRHIEGLLTNNTQVTHYFQEKLNEELLEMAYSLDKVQQAFIKLLNEEEIRKFAL